MNCQHFLEMQEYSVKCRKSMGLCIFAQKYLHKFEDTYFILQNMYLHIYEDSFEAKILRDDCPLILLNHSSEK